MAEEEYTGIKKNRLTNILLKFLGHWRLGAIGRNWNVEGIFMEVTAIIVARAGSVRIKSKSMSLLLNEKNTKTLNLTKSVTFEAPLQRYKK